MNKIILLLIVVFLAGCSNKIVPDNYHAMNPIRTLPGVTVTTIRWDGFTFGKTHSDYMALIEKQFPNAVGIYVDSSANNVFYVFTSNKE